MYFHIQFHYLYFERKNITLDFICSYQANFIVLWILIIV